MMKMKGGREGRREGKKGKGKGKEKVCTLWDLPLYCAFVPL